jgi:7-cyano-7-deazaguanine synthase in queuosine biosynthesis
LSFSLKRTSASPTVLINYSGGIDSVFAAWQALKQGERVLIHHCILKNRNNRYNSEKAATAATLNYFKKVGLTNYKYVESGFDYGTIGYLIYDVEIIGFLTGVVLRNPRYSNLDRVIVSVNANDPTGRDINNFRRSRANLYAESVSGKSIKWEYPMIHMTKEEIIGKMPKELALSCWWCRRPKSSGKPCGSCPPCKEVLPIMNKLTK